MDKRDLVVEKLSRMVNVNVVRGDPTSFMVYVGSQYLVQGQKMRHGRRRKSPEGRLC